jgi:hypothetical protein
VSEAEARLRVNAVWSGSNGDATRALYSDLEAIGQIGFVATNLFRASKNSLRAKSYRRRSYKGQAYDRKQWAMDNLAAALSEHAAALGITWGWGADTTQSFHSSVLYIDLPEGQVSYHTEARGDGPDYAGAWDGVRGVSDVRVCNFCIRVLSGEPSPARSPVTPRASMPATEAEQIPLFAA